MVRGEILLTNWFFKNIKLLETGDKILLKMGGYKFIKSWLKLMLKWCRKLVFIDDENGGWKIVKNRPKIDPLKFD
jgi:hypothetical protein